MLFDNRMRSAAALRARHRRYSRIRRAVRRRWADYVVIVVLVAACLVALLLLLDVIDTTIAKPDRPGTTATP
jgi:hypothetical protein